MNEKKRRKFEENKNRKPILSWRCIDDFDKAYPDNVCWVGEIDISKRQAVVLRQVFSQMREKWTKVICKALYGDEESLEISGGNYTFFFVLPAVFNYFRERHPFLSVNLSLFELSEAYDFGDCGADIILSGFYKHMHHETAIKKQILEEGYVFQRHIFKDYVFLASSFESVNEFGSKEEVLRKQDIVFDRVYESYAYNKKEKKNTICYYTFW